MTDKLNEITIEDIIKESEAEFDKKFKDGVPSIIIHQGGTDNSWIEHPEIKQFLSQSIRQAVETAFKEIEVEKMNVEELGYSDKEYARGVNIRTDEIESLKKKFLNK